MTDKQPHPTAWMIRWHEGEYPCSMITELNPNPAEKNETITPLYATPDPRIAELERDLAAVQAEAEKLREWQVRKNDAFAALEADLAAAQARADAMLRVAERYEAEAAALKTDLAAAQAEMDDLAAAQAEVKKLRPIYHAARRVRETQGMTDLSEHLHYLYAAIDAAIRGDSNG